MNKENLNMIKFKGELKDYNTEQMLIEAIISAICAIPNYESQKGSIHVIIYILEALKNGLKSNSTLKLDNKSVCVCILKRIFPSLTDVELSFIQQNIDILLLDSKRIQSLGFVKRNKKWLTNLIKKKFAA